MQKHKEKVIIRLLSITSIQQLFIGLACMKKNEEKNNVYHNYLIINNTMLLDESVKSIRIAASEQNFKVIIDFREHLIWYLSSKSNGNKIGKKVLRFYKKIIKHNSRIMILIQKLYEYYQTNKIDEIYMRYKLNFPEKILLTAFHEADIHLFEDGLGDYLPRKYQSKKLNKDNSLRRYLLKKMMHGMMLRIQSSRLQQADDLYKRVKGVYELISNREGHRKQWLQKNVRVSFQNIKNEYIYKIKLAYEKLSVNVTERSSFVLLLPTAFSAGHLWYPDRERIRIRDDIKFTGDIVNAIKIRFPDSDIIIKTHPRTPRALREAFEGNFIDGVCNIDTSSVLPAEAYFVDSHFEAMVAGAYSSSLMYAAEVFNKKAYYCRPPKHLAKYYPKGAVYTTEKTLEKLGVKKITISETLSAA